MENSKIRWGFLGAGAIIDRFIKGVRQFDDMEVVAVSSRTHETAKKMADKYNISEVLTYDEMINRADIDVVYIAVPHTQHKELTVKALNAGKAVLCEKPAGINAAEWEEMVEAAKKNDVFLMEAAWTWFSPLIKSVQEVIRDGKIGEVRAVSSNFSFRNTDLTSRLLDPERAGGGLLDTGVYNLHFQRMIYGKTPSLITGVASMDTDDDHLKIDEQAAYIAQYDKGELGMMCSAVRTDMIDTAYVYGTKGHIVIPVFWKPTKYMLTIGDKTETIEIPVPQCVDGIEDEGYQFEIAHVNECIRAGKKESPVITFEITESVLKQCDELRKIWGLKYPQES